MAKTITLDWNSFMRGENVPKAAPDTPPAPPVWLTGAAAAYLVIMPAPAHAAGGGTFMSVMDTVLGIADYACWGIIVYSGGTWMFGTRTKAIEIILGGSIGYLIVRHAKDIQEWLKTL